MLRRSSFHQTELSNRWIIVKYSPEAERHAKARPIHEKKTSKQPSILDGMVRIEISSEEDPIAVCNEFLKDPNVIYAEPVVKNHLLEVPSDPSTGDQFYLALIRAYDAWELTKGDDDIAIAIIDSGIDLLHEDLAGKLWVNELDPVDGIDNDGNGYIDDYSGYDFADSDNDPTAEFDSHGTQVAGIAGASTNNAVGMAGVGYNTKIAALKGFRSQDGTAFGLFNAILYAADNGIEVLNLSWGSIREPLQSEQDIIDFAVLEKDVVVVAAAGNDGAKSTAEEKFYPASYNHVLSVAGSTSADLKWSGSSYNYAVDLVAPALGIFTTSNGSQYSTSGAGTSFAAPMVAATAALVKDHYPTLSAIQIMERIRVTTDDIYSLGSNSDFDGKLGSGRLNMYRALAESSLKSLRANDITVSKVNGDPIFYGDTVNITLNLTNHLNPLNDLALYVSAPEGELKGSTQSFFPGVFASAEQKPLSFDLVLSESLPPQTQVDVRMDYQDGSYTDFQFIEIETAPDFANFGNSGIHLSIAGDGGLGVLDDALELGDGLIYEKDTLLRNVGILLAGSDEMVADNVISNFETKTREDDFQTETYFKIQHHPFADRHATSTFNDQINGIQVTQSNLTSDTGAFLINRYRLVNTSNDTLQQLAFGLFADWDLTIPTENVARFDSINQNLYVRNIDSSLYAGTMIIASGVPLYTTLDLGDYHGNARDVDDTFPDSAKYRHLVTERQVIAGQEGAGNDVAGLHGISIEQLNPNDFAYVNVLFAVGKSSAELTSNFQEAQAYLSGFLQQPTLLETIFTCAGGSATLDPESGDMFIFYQDALGNLPLDTGTTFTPTVTSDTSFYVRNVDLDFPSEISELRLRLSEDFSDFHSSVDTLYLDDPAVNVVQFFDQSIDPVSWSWDFGQGTQSTLQNPSINFNEPGIYQVSLTVENSSGCTDTHMRDLIVVNRPGELSFDPITLCPDEIQQLTHSSATSLFLYATASQQQPSASGTSVPIGPFRQDTSIYIAGRVAGFLTPRTLINVAVEEIEGAIFVFPDTTLTEFLLRAVAEVEETSTVEWTLNGMPAGSDRAISADALAGEYTFGLQVISSSGCILNAQEIFEVSSSPTPEVADYVGCAGTSVTLTPSNGEYFGFYADVALDTLISKGSSLMVTEEDQVYVVNLDDGLPGQSVQSNISFEVFEPSIAYSVTRVGERNKVELSVESEVTIESFQWYVDGEKSEISPMPNYFFEDQPVTIVLEAMSETGCTNSDTLLLDFTPPVIPLGIPSDIFARISPNPSKGVISLHNIMFENRLVIRSISGKMLLELDSVPQILDLTDYDAGVYILELHSDLGVQKLKILLE